jgi:hypothetical protein
MSIHDCVKCGDQITTQRSGQGVVLVHKSNSGCKFHKVPFDIGFWNRLQLDLLEAKAVRVIANLKQAYAANIDQNDYVIWDVRESERIGQGTTLWEAVVDADLENKEYIPEETIQAVEKKKKK